MLFIIITIITSLSVSISVYLRITVFLNISYRAGIVFKYLYEFLQQSFCSKVFTTVHCIKIWKNKSVMRKHMKFIGSIGKI